MAFKNHELRPTIGGIMDVTDRKQLTVRQTLTALVNKVNCLEASMRFNGLVQCENCGVWCKPGMERDRNAVQVTDTDTICDKCIRHCETVWDRYEDDEDEWEQISYELARWIRCRWHKDDRAEAKRLAGYFTAINRFLHDWKNKEITPDYLRSGLATWRYRK